MKFDEALHRDQRRLAVAKFDALPEGNPLRERYRDWIRRLDEIIASVVLPTQDENSNALVTITGQLDDVSDLPASHIISLPGAISQSPADLGRPIGSTNRKAVRQPASALAPQHAKLKMEKDFGRSRKSEKAAVCGHEAQARKDRLIAENRLLKCMLVRFG